MEGNIFESDLVDSNAFSSSSSSESSIQSWISWFCSLSGNEYYLEVPEEFIDDEFNLTGLSNLIPYYTQALETILDMECGEFFDLEEQETEEESDDNNNNNNNFWIKDKKRMKMLDSNIIEPYAFMLYGLIHQRYLLTRDGLKLMAERYKYGEFGNCPRYYCRQSFVLPMGKFDQLGKESLHLYCPVCLDIYIPPNSMHQSIDGAHFGTTYSNLLFLTFPELVPKVKYEIYQPSIFGFKISSLSLSGPKNQWLRLRPQQLDNDADNDDNDSNYNNEKLLQVDDLSCNTKDLHI